MRQDIYQKVTDKIIADLEQGELTWLKPWSAGNMDGRMRRESIRDQTTWA